ncbi:hypothetical protein T08_7095 [Trichinella sp. T8]|nr:hypothetical protein T08_7095 [Trichinella sp. T8]
MAKPQGEFATANNNLSIDDDHRLGYTRFSSVARSSFSSKRQLLIANRRFCCKRNNSVQQIGYRLTLAPVA